LKLKIDEMEWTKAIEESKKGTAIRIIHGDNGSKRTIIKYKDGSGYCLASQNGKVDYLMSRPAQEFEMNGFNDWQPGE
jgi:TusA-related sulfurtransferase